MSEQNRWLEITSNDPDHSKRYVERFDKMEAEGRDLGGEVRFVDAMAQRGSRILDAGCGPGRVGGRLAALGHTVVGVDLDPILIEAAITKYPESTWVVGDLSDVDLIGQPVGGRFDVVVSAGNVMRFLAPSTRVAVLANLGSSLAEEGRLVVGFGSGGGEYDNEDFFDDVTAAGLIVELTLSTWDLLPFTPDSEFLIAVLRQDVMR